MENMTIKQTGICGICGSSCLIDATLEHGRIVSVQKAETRPNLRGDFCTMGAALKQFVYHPERLKYPMRRVGPKGSGQFERISWDEAFQTIADELNHVRALHGAESVVFYCGNPKWYRQMMADVARKFGSPNFCTESCMCRSAKEMAWVLNYGVPHLPEDIKNCQTLLIWTSNQAKPQMISDIKARGGNVIVVDPRHTRSSERSTLHLQLIPGTDGALAHAIAHVIIAEGLEDKSFLARYAHGFEAYKEYIAQFTPQRGEEITGVPAEKIIQAAHVIARGACSVLTSSSAVVQAVNGVQNLRAVFLLLALTGSFDRPGGNHSSSGEKVKLNGWHHDLGERPGFENDVSGGRFPLWNEIIYNEAQAVKLADAILNEDPYPLHCLLAFGMNIHMWPNSQKMKQALEKIPFCVATDLFWTEACDFADIILPSSASPQRDQVIVQGDWVHFIPRLIEPEECRNDIEILLGISRALNLQGGLAGLRDYNDYLNYLLEPTGLSLDELRRHPEGLPGKKIPGESMFSYEAGLPTPTKKVEFVSSLLENHHDLPGHSGLPIYFDYRDIFTQEELQQFPLILSTGARKPQFCHSRTYRISWLSNLEPHTLVHINPNTAASYGIAEGDPVIITTPKGEMDFIASLDTGVLPNVVHILHGDKDQDINAILDDSFLDPISGFPGVKSYICNIQKAEVAK